jgi:hypothetical protein
MQYTKQFTAFLSFADPDREIVGALHDLFWHMREPTYFAPSELPRTGSPAWREEIIKGIHRSYCFVPIYTRHSIQRPWVLYESGVADSIDLPRFPARVSGLDVSEVDYLPSPGAYVYSLFDKDSLADLLISVCACKGGNKDKIIADAHRVVETSGFADKIVKLSKTRWVFIAGNVPSDQAALQSQISWFSTMEDYTAQLQTFVARLTQTLLANGFSVAACPQVSAVGLQVINTAVDSMATETFAQPVDYRISGIYPIDREARKSILSETAKRQWLAHIMEFRKSYLDDQEWLLTIGGNQGTAEEYAAAKDCKLKILPIPCFGGTSKRIWQDEPGARCGPCQTCNQTPRDCGAACIGAIVAFLKRNGSDSAPA